MSDPAHWAEPLSLPYRQAYTEANGQHNPDPRVPNSPLDSLIAEKRLPIYFDSSLLRQGATDMTQLNSAVAGQTEADIVMTLLSMISYLLHHPAMCRAPNDAEGSDEIGEYQKDPYKFAVKLNAQKSSLSLEPAGIAGEKTPRWISDIEFMLNPAGNMVVGWTFWHLIVDDSIDLGWGFKHLLAFNAGNRAKQREAIERTPAAKAVASPTHVAREYYYQRVCDSDLLWTYFITYMRRTNHPAYANGTDWEQRNDDTWLTEMLSDAPLGPLHPHVVFSTETREFLCRRTTVDSMNPVRDSQRLTLMYQEGGTVLAPGPHMYPHPECVVRMLSDVYHPNVLPSIRLPKQGDDRVDDETGLLTKLVARKRNKVPPASNDTFPSTIHMMRDSLKPDDRWIKIDSRDTLEKQREARVQFMDTVCDHLERYYTGDSGNMCKFDNACYMWLQNLIDNADNADEVGGEASTFSFVFNDDIVDGSLTEYGNLCQRLFLQLEEVVFCSTNHSLLALHLRASRTGSMYPRPGKPEDFTPFNILSMGDKCAGKSFVFECIKQCMVPGTYLERDTQSAMALTCGSHNIKMVVIKNELGENDITGHAADKNKSGNTSEKQRLETGVVKNEMCTLVPGENGRTVRKMEETTSVHLGVELAATNSLHSDNPNYDAILSRRHRVRVPFIKRPGRNVSDVRGSNHMSDRLARQRLQQFQVEQQSLQFWTNILYQMLFLGNLHVELRVAYAVQTHIIRHLQKYGCYMADARDEKRMMKLCLQATLEWAVYKTFSTPPEQGYLTMRDKQFKRGELHLKEFRRCAEQWLVCTPEIVFECFGQTESAFLIPHDQIASLLMSIVVSKCNLPSDVVEYDAYMGGTATPCWTWGGQASPDNIKFRRTQDGYDFNYFAVEGVRGIEELAKIGCKREHNGTRISLNAAKTMLSEFMPDQKDNIKFPCYGRTGPRFWDLADVENPDNGAKRVCRDVIIEGSDRAMNTFYVNVEAFLFYTDFGSETTPKCNGRIGKFYGHYRDLYRDAVSTIMDKHSLISNYVIGQTMMRGTEQYPLPHILERVEFSPTEPVVDDESGEELELCFYEHLRDIRHIQHSLFNDVMLDYFFEHLKLFEPDIVVGPELGEDEMDDELPEEIDEDDDDMVALFRQYPEGIKFMDFEQSDYWEQAIASVGESLPEKSLIERARKMAEVYAARATAGSGAMLGRGGSYMCPREQRRRRRKHQGELAASPPRKKRWMHQLGEVSSDDE